MYRYEEMAPVKFREGDIVEAQLSFSLVPIKRGFYKMIAVLRSVTLLDSSFSQVRLASARLDIAHAYSSCYDL
jgi:hypothetical protein